MIFLQVESKYYENFGEPEISENFSNKNLDLEPRQKSSQVPYLNFGVLKCPKYDVKIGESEIDTNIVLRLTAGDGKIDLSKLELKNLDLEMTARNIDLTLENTSAPDNVGMEVTAGDMTLTVPKDIALEINYKKLQ